MKTSSAKAKGRRLQDAVREMLYETYTGLRDGDIKTAIMGESGRDIVLSPAAEDIIPFDIEAKNQEKLNIWAALEQAESNKKEGRIPLLVFKRNRSKTYAVLEFEKLLELLNKKENEKMKEFKIDLGNILTEQEIEIYEKEGEKMKEFTVNLGNILTEQEIEIYNNLCEKYKVDNMNELLDVVKEQDEEIIETFMDKIKSSNEVQRKLKKEVEKLFKKHFPKEIKIKL